MKKAFEKGLKELLLVKIYTKLMTFKLNFRKRVNFRFITQLRLSFKKDKNVPKIKRNNCLLLTDIKGGYGSLNINIKFNKLN